VIRGRPRTFRPNRRTTGPGGTGEGPARESSDPGASGVRCHEAAISHHKRVRFVRSSKCEVYGRRAGVECDRFPLSEERYSPRAISPVRFDPPVAAAGRRPLRRCV